MNLKTKKYCTGKYNAGSRRIPDTIEATVSRASGRASFIFHQRTANENLEGGEISETGWPLKSGDLKGDVAIRNA